MEKIDSTLLEFELHIQYNTMRLCQSKSMTAACNDSHSALSGQKQGNVNHTHVELQHSPINQTL